MLSLDKFFFDKDDQGKEIFYLWGGPPGEAIYVVDKNQKTNIKLFVFFLFFIYAAIIILFILWIFLKSFTVPDYFWASLFGNMPLMYLLGAYFIKGKAELLVLPKENRQHPRKELFLLLGGGILIQIPALKEAIEEQTLAFIIFSFFSIFLISIFFWKLYKTKGYFFSE